MLAAATPEAWVDAAVERWQELLVDHANCEKKAASTALALLFAYPEDQRLGLALARLAREELRHFEQVQKWMLRLGVAPQRMGPGRYAGGLRRHLAAADPQRKVDLMLCGALIEARSCERFELLASRLPAPLGTFYGDLAEAERRHGVLYLELAQEAAGQDEREGVQQRLAQLAREEARLITTPDEQFRFHSGVPA
ncbi:MAG: tRNA isopentenyl-2-thiomethyl-A-37 hydroxylase MiaE [Steroidobacteraceae bacterium]